MLGSSVEVSVGDGRRMWGVICIARGWCAMMETSMKSGSVWSGWKEVDDEMSCVVSRVKMGGRVKREDGGRRCGGEFGAECTCTAWYEMMEKSIGSERVCRGRRRRCGDARCERYQCVFVLSNRIW